MLVEFRNVTIGIEADTPEAAYEIMCKRLAEGETWVEWVSDTFVTYPTDSLLSETESRSTEELFG